jgi:hypothetical protein
VFLEKVDVADSSSVAIEPLAEFRPGLDSIRKLRIEPGNTLNIPLNKANYQFVYPSKIIEQNDVIQELSLLDGDLIIVC